jgi:hypothetical protein
MDFSEEEARALMLLTGFKVHKVHVLANKYWPVCEEYADLRSRSPWFLLKTQYGLIQLGWRKRVLVIDWSDIVHLDGTTITDDDTTKTSTMIHAWSYYKAVQYLQSLRRAFVVTGVIEYVDPSE